jgi:hypothetical protein
VVQVQVVLQEQLIKVVAVEEVFVEPLEQQVVQE